MKDMVKIPQSPDSAKTFFKNLIFPCGPSKKPAVPYGTSWRKWTGDIESIGLAGLDCGRAGIVVFDFDLYKPDFKNSPQSQTLYKKVKELSQFMQKTQSGGEHYFFKQPEGQKITNKAPLPGIETRGSGGYVCIYSLPFLPEAGIETFEDFYKLLPVWPEGILIGFEKQKPKPGLGKTNEWANSGFSTFANGTPAEIVEKLFEIKEGYKKAPGKTSKTEFKQKLKKSLQDGLKDRLKEKKPESDFLNIPIEAELDTLDNVKPVNIEYLDQQKIIIKNVLITLTGEKSAGKSGGMISYLLSEGKNILYFSDYENSKTLIKYYQHLAKQRNFKGKLVWFSMDRLNEKESFEKFKQAIKDHKIDIVFEDPPLETSDFYKQETLRKILGARLYWAEKLGISWVLTRNYSKNTGKQIDLQISGFKAWSNVPRAVLNVKRIDHNSKSYADNIRERDDLEGMSILHSELVNLGSRPDKSIILKFPKTSKDAPATQICFEPVDRPKDLIQFCKGQSQAEKETKESNEFIALRILKQAINNKKELKSEEWVEKIMEKRKCSKATAKRTIKALKAKKHIRGGGSGPSFKPFKILTKGTEFLDD